MSEFAHLHLHTEYSLLDGMGRIQDYVSSAQQMGMQHMAVTDHGVMYGAMDWYKAATKAGIHPIVGMEAYMAEGSARENNRKMYHLLLLAENNTGYHNLIKLASEASLKGFYYRPRVDLDMLQQFGEGIIATSACLGGPVANNFLNHQPDKAYHYAGALSEIFGKERFFIEIQDHGLSEQHMTNGLMIEMAKKYELPLVATNDVHYCNKHDAPAQDILMCVSTGKTVHDHGRLKHETDEFYLKSPDEMARLFPDHAQALQNTIRIAEMCNVNLEFGGYQLPEFATPDGSSSEDYLRRLCTEGVMQKYGSLDGQIGERLDYELGVIANMGFTNYFLIVWDFVAFAKRNGILVGPGRGSAASSIVTYSLDITGLDPLKHNLMFERFLNPSRISMPDIDIDFADDRRGEVIDYVVQKYGDDRVAGIATFGTLKAKAAIKDCARAMGYAVSESDRIAKLIPADVGTTIDSAMESVQELAAAYKNEPAVKELIDTAKKVEGLNRHPGKHAAGVVISRDPLVEHVPLQLTGKGRTDVTTQWTQGHLEDLGLLKMDFLGLKTLTVLGRAVNLARAAGADITMDTIPLEDEGSFELLRRGDTFGVFQLEGGMTTRMTIDVQPESFDDIIALMALIRPGPMELAPDYIGRKHGRLSIEYPHPSLEDVLKETYGVALYQEQVMLIANVLAGFSMAEADGLRKAMGKKLPAVMAEYKGRFVEGAAGKGVSAKDANAVWDMIEKFAGYGFVKSHSAAYGVIAAQTAYMKAHYPAQFMAALMSTEIESSEKTVVNVGECVKAGIPVLPPDINRSDIDFTVEFDAQGKPAVRFGLAAVKGVGKHALESVIEARSEREDHHFPTLDAVCDAIDWNSGNKKLIESLVKAGVMDEYGHRAQVLVGMEQLAGAAQKRQRARSRGQMDMFGALIADTSEEEMGTVLPVVAEADQKQILEWEKEVLGLYLSSHPLTEVVGTDLPGGFNRLNQVKGMHSGQTSRVVGMIKTVRRVITKTNKTMAVLEVEDLTGSMEVVVFPKKYDEFASLLNPDAILVIEAKVEERNDQVQLILETLSDRIPGKIDKVIEKDAVIIQFPLRGEHWEDVSLLQKIDLITQEFEGDHPLELAVQICGSIRMFRSRSRRVEWSPSFIGAIENAVGKESVRIRVMQP
ncbi:MAG: DNA polymerase III subunit alpha [Thermomicrobiales bacterium]|nr:DNA polymerase III subunit alpha [Thermomicrobiales bacterium]